MDSRIINGLSPRAIYHRLHDLDLDDLPRSAECREQAQALIADPSLSLPWRQAISRRLQEINHLLELRVSTENGSY